MALSWRDQPISTKGLIVIAIPVLPLILTAVLFVQSEFAEADARADLERASQNRFLQTRLLSLALEAETSVRGYLLSRNKGWIEHGRRSQAETVALMAQLDTGTRDPEQRERLPRLGQLIAVRFDALNGVLEAYQSSGLNAPEMIVHVRRGGAAMNELRAHTDLMLRRNSELLAARTARADTLRTRTSTIVLLGAGAGVLGGIFAAVLFTTGISRRVAAATRDVSRLAAGEPLPHTEPAGDEIGALRSGMERAETLLAQRDQQLQQRMQELEALTRELEAFSYSVSHDLRAPLRHIAGFASMLQQSAGDALTDQQRRHIRVIVDAAAQMGRLIDDLLAFSRTGRMELRRDIVDVGAIVRDVQTHLVRESNGRHIDWRLHPLPMVQGDAALLRIVFDNLLTNAVKYTGPREHATIEIGTGPVQGGEAVVYVRDNGVGFDMTYADKLFGVFQRLHSSDAFEGTGIGLATVRRIVARHGGRVWGEGRPAEGATFYVALPTEGGRA